MGSTTGVAGSVELHATEDRATRSTTSTNKQFDIMTYSSIGYGSDDRYMTPRHFMISVTGIWSEDTTDIIDMNT